MVSPTRRLPIRWAFPLVHPNQTFPRHGEFCNGWSKQMSRKWYMRHHDNDMDDFYREAAEGYSLNTAAADWQKVYASLAPAESASVHPRKRGRFCRLLLRLPLAFFFQHTAGRHN